MATLKINPKKSYRATLIEGLVYNLGFRRFDKGVPQKVDAELATVLQGKHYMSDLQKSNKKVESVKVPYFDLEEIEDEEEEASKEAIADTTKGEGEGEGESTEETPAKARPRTVQRAKA